MRGGRGMLVIVSGPSGVGKTTVCERLLQDPSQRFVASISATTRLPRPGERHERDYVFMNREAFERDRQEERFLEWAIVYDNYYGTPRGPVQAHLASGKNVVMNIDVQGAAQVRRSGLPVISFFLLPPSLSVLRERIGRRGDSPADIERRMRDAQREIDRQQEYDHQIVNDDLERTVETITSLIGERANRETAEG